MDVQITIRAELDDPDTLQDTLDILNKMLPYIFDNVVVTSALHDPHKTAEEEKAWAEYRKYTDPSV